MGLEEKVKQTVDDFWAWVCRGYHTLGPGGSLEDKIDIEMISAQQLIL